jgi:HKD family nuclease
MTKLFSNSNKRNDFLRNEMEKYGVNNEVCIAVAFFTDNQFIHKLVKNGCNVRLIVRLGFPTNPYSLKSIIGIKNVQIRFFTSKKFHPKLYLFGYDKAYLGSSNLTDGGLMGNQELNTAINSEDSQFEELGEIFEDYWEEAVVLTEERLEIYSKLVAGLDKHLERVEQNIKTEIGEFEYSNIKNLSLKKKDKVSEHEDNLLRRYQLFLNNFKELEGIYMKTNRRMVSENELPLRIEIHRFLNWIRNDKAKLDLYLKAPKRSGQELIDFVQDQITEYFNVSSPSDFDYNINTYQNINQNLISIEKIKSLSESELLETLLGVTAFYDHVRHSEGFALKETFLQQNGIDRIKNTLLYLLFDKEDFRKRIAKCVHAQEYKLTHFGRSCIQETYGWVNKEKIPICNERAYKSMQWLGFGRM